MRNHESIALLHKINKKFARQQVGVRSMEVALDSGK
jgi:hypothetical protein